VIPWLDADDPFPDVSRALSAKTGAGGLLAVSADLSPERIVSAYRQGIFPWYSEGQPVLWWSPDPRMVLPTARFAVSRSLRKKLRQVERSMSSDRRWQVRFDSDFEAVMRACADVRIATGEGTWITEEMVYHYVRLHQMGIAHSSAVWLEGRLVGGIYGLCIGHMFFGESQFFRVRDASKIALAWLVRFLREKGVQWIDCQQETAHLASLGAISLSRASFLQILAKTIDLPAPTFWADDVSAPAW
jgi:leucyl/phenylalanyl-tRNA--protein transferase